MKERVMRWVFALTACASIAAVILICVFLFANGVPAMAEIGFFNFVGGQRWKPSSGLYGIWPMIVGSLYVPQARSSWACRRVFLRLCTWRAFATSGCIGS